MFTVADGFLRDPCSIFAVPALVKLDAAFAVCGAVDTEHTEIAHVHAELLNSTTPIQNIISK